MNLRSFVVATLWISIACVSGITAQPQNQPDLVVVLAVDQMRQDFFDRFGEYFNGGLKRLMDEGVMFTNAHHEHALTNTAPGHAALMTGRHPANNGIVNNSYYDKEVHEEEYCVGDPYEKVIGVANDGAIPARSPRRMKASTIGDWIKKSDSDSRVFSVSKKDRAAVIMGGQDADGAFWFDNVSTKFITSTYYTKEYPSWADEFVGSKVMYDQILAGWNKFAPEEVYADLRPDDFEVEGGAFMADFPHNRVRMRAGVPRSQRTSIFLTTTPMADELVLKFARLLIEQEDLGRSGHTDMIAVGCSGADAIGHHFGPESHEVMDYFLYLDSYLDDFFTFLDERYGRDEYWVVLVSDHGANPMPEALQMRGVDAQRIQTSDVQEDLDEIEERAKAKLGLSSVVIESVLGGIYLNFLESDARGIPRGNVRKVVASLLRTLPYIEDTYTIDDFKSRKTKPYLENYRRSFDDRLSADIMYRLKENYLIHGPYGTSHGSVYEYDTHVPVVFYIPGMPPAKVDRRVATVDVAPTMAALLNIKADKKVDGQVIEEMLNAH